MTRRTARHSSPKASATRRQTARQGQTRAVARPEPLDRVATVRLVAKAVLWAAFFAGLFTLHAHVVMRTAALRAESSRLQEEIRGVMDDRGPVAKALWEVQESGRLRASAQQQLGMVTVLSQDRLAVDPRARREVLEAVAVWRRSADETTPVRSPLIRILAGLWTDPETTG